MADPVEVFEKFPVLHEIFDLLDSKAADYNSNKIIRSDYFPFGQLSYTQMIHTKVLRLQSLSQPNLVPNHESIRDTLIDLINYTLFNLEAIDNEEC